MISQRRTRHLAPQVIASKLVLNAYESRFDALDYAEVFSTIATWRQTRV